MVRSENESTALSFKNVIDLNWSAIIQNYNIITKYTKNDYEC